jgi:hypothetical protein
MFCNFHAITLRLRKFNSNINTDPLPLERMKPESNKKEISLKILREELELNGILFTPYHWLNSRTVMEEIQHAIRPVIHEGKVYSYGVLCADSLDDLERYEIINMNPDLLGQARKLADGVEWNILYHQDRFHGLIRFPLSLSGELQMLKRFPARGGMMIYRSETGACRFYQGEKLILHDRRNWTIKPEVKTRVACVASCIEKIDKKLLQSILEFAYYMISPTEGAGAILIWNLKPIKTMGNLGHLGLSFQNESHLRMIFHQLIQTDGATMISYDGLLMSSGFQIRYSAKSKRMIPDFRGTRHTSSIRFSFDSPNTLIITISEDGPVSIFFNGVNLTDLNYISPQQMLRKIRSITPEEKSKILIFRTMFQCNRCDRRSVIDRLDLNGKNKVFYPKCPTCQHESEPMTALEYQIRPGTINDFSK